MAIYDKLRIRNFLANRVNLKLFCFFLESTMGARYLYQNLPGQIPAERSIYLIQMATQNDELGDLIYLLAKYWIEDLHGSEMVLYNTGLIEDLVMFHEELISDGRLEEAQNVFDMLQNLGVELPTTGGRRIRRGRNETGQVSNRQSLALSISFDCRVDSTQIIWDSPMGYHTSAFRSPYDSTTLPVVLRALDAVQWTEYPKAGPGFDSTDRELLAACGLWTHERVSFDVHERVGRELHAALVSDHEAQSALSTVRNHAAASGLPLNYVLRFPPRATEMVAHPWELLWDERGALLLDGCQPPSCVRHLLLPWALPNPSPVGSELGILAIAPVAGIPKIVRDDERQARNNAWKELVATGNVTMEELSPATPEGLIERIRNGPSVDIVHFYGHGRYRDGKGSLLFDDPKGGEIWLAADQLAVALCDTRLIMLHACHSSRVGNAGPLTGVAPALSAAGVPAVVAMQMAIRIDAATKFSGVVYQALARGESIQAAVSRARRDLYVCEPDRASWYVPTLTICSRDTGPLRLIEPAKSSDEGHRRPTRDG